MAGEKRKQTTIDMTRTTADTTMSRPFRTFWNVYIYWTCECRAIFLHTYIWITQRKRYTYKQHNENKSQSQCQLLCAAHATFDSFAHTTYKSGQTRLTAIYWCLFCTFSPHKMRCVACENHNVYGKRIDCMRLFLWLMILLSFATHTHTGWIQLHARISNPHGRQSYSYFITARWSRHCVFCRLWWSRWSQYWEIRFKTSPQIRHKAGRISSRRCCIGYEKGNEREQLNVLVIPALTQSIDPHGITDYNFRWIVHNFINLSDASHFILQFRLFSILTRLCSMLKNWNMKWADRPPSLVWSKIKNCIVQMLAIHEP